MKLTFGQTLRNLRLQNGMTQRELAKKISVDFSYISKLENNRMPPPAADTMVRICEVLEVPPDELLALTGKMPSDIKDVISGNPAALKFIRNAQNMRLTGAEWEELTKQLKKLRG